MSYRKLEISPEEKDSLRRRFLQTPEIAPLASDPRFFARIVALGIHQEIGTIHDELSTFLFDARTGRKVPRERLRSELIDYRGFTGVRLWVEGTDQLDPRVRGMRSLLHPELSFDREGKIFQLVFFPETIVKIAALEGAELVSVRPWGINTVFGGFDPTKSYYAGNMWEFINIDSVRYARLLEKRQIAFWGTHDLVSHVAGIRKSAWPALTATAGAARAVFEDYFGQIENPVPFCLVLPYVLGILLDDLAQPMNYDSESRRHVVDLLMQAIRRREVKPNSSTYLLRYPPAAERVITIARANNLKAARQKAQGIVAELIGELHSYSAVTH